MPTLKVGSLPADTCHLCVDVPRLIQEQTAWFTPWLPRVLPQIEEITAWAAPRNFFTLFMPPLRKEDARGAWRRYYEKWSHLTLENLTPELLDIVQSLQPYAVQGQVVHKPVYSPWGSGQLHNALQDHKCSTLVITGGESDMCVLSTVLGAVDYGYRVVVAEDAICSGSDEGHDRALSLFQERYQQQIEVAKTETLLSAWQKVHA